MRSATVAQQAGITYRQLDYWCRRGYLHPHVVHGGQGDPRQWSEREALVARAMAQLVEAGFSVARAAEMARLAHGGD